MYELVSAANLWVAMCDLAAIRIFLRLRRARTTLKKEVRLVLWLFYLLRNVTKLYRPHARSIWVWSLCVTFTGDWCWCSSLLDLALLIFIFSSVFAFHDVAKFNI
jgi:hypothetical protein